MYLIRARFDKLSETPHGPLIGFGHKMSTSRKDREIKLKNFLSKKELKTKILEHYKKYNGEINFFGRIKYYEFYDNFTLLYKLDTFGNIVEK